MLQIEGKHQCNSQMSPDCKHEFEWTAIVPEEISSRTFDFESQEKTFGRVVQRTEAGYVVRMRCPKCMQDNFIEYAAR